MANVEELDRRILSLLAKVSTSASAVLSIPYEERPAL